MSKTTAEADRTVPQESATCMACGESHPVKALDIIEEGDPLGPKRICAYCDAKINAHLDLWEVIEAMECVDWGVVPGISVQTVATFQERLREADDELSGDITGDTDE